MTKIPQTPRPRIFVDADACPKLVKEIVFRLVQKQKLPAIFVSNKFQMLPSNDMIFQVVVASGPDEADLKIVELADSLDLVITADIPLAASLVKNGVLTINPRGEVYTEENIGPRLADRNLMTDLRGEGKISGGPKGFSDRDKQNFANSLDKHVTRLKR